MNTKIIAIVAAAGLGKRFDAYKRKIFVSLRGTPLLIHTLKRLHDEESITEIIPVLRPEYIKKGFELIKEHKLNKIKHIARGGQERQDSVYNALKLFEEVGDAPYRESLILIHDGARPIIPHGTISKLIEEAISCDGVAPGIPVKDTLKEVSSNNIVVSTVNREKICAIQTPQAFPYKVIKKAYEKAYAQNFYATDDTALVERIGGKVKIIEGSPFNIKITTFEDLEMVKYILENVKIKNQNEK